MATLYKYRTLDNWKFLMDIVLHRRLFAAPFRDLNDPMEGRYRYRGDEVSRAFRRALSESKNYWRICSLSRNPVNTLMWSYYGGGHSGVALGVDVAEDPEVRVEPVFYDNEINIGEDHLHRDPLDVAVEVLSQKQYGWVHEDEVRVFSPQPFVEVQLREVRLGCQVAAADEQLIRTLVERADSAVPVHKVERSELDRPLDELDG
ncbi:hypothetical protein ABI59_16035 [Acidobacteria bacterium Mor1]|nr:hypothetical protein ABI59_16035 [Acidobacteria bacterium Mor1]